jgi:hypothetical protein
MIRTDQDHTPQQQRQDTFSHRLTSAFQQATSALQGQRALAANL